MDDLKLSDNKVLEFDINQCTVREFCEVFTTPQEVAKGLIEYRQEILHIFKFEQLLKLKGFSRELLQQWSKPASPGTFNAELQKNLDLPPSEPAPISALFEAACRSTGAKGCLMTVRDGAMILKSAPEDNAFDLLASLAERFMRPAQEDLLTMNLGTADAQVLSFDSGDAIFLPAGGFCLAIMQSPRSFTAANLSLWKALAAEIRQRHPPRAIIDNNATVNDTDVAFDCPQCQLRLVMEKEGAGFSFPCPRCKTTVTVPTETTSFSPFLAPETQG